MRLQIRGHPRQRMAQRGVTEADIEHALTYFQTRWQTPTGGTQYVGPGIGGRRLKVWLVPPGLDADPVIVKSVAWAE